MGGVICFAFDFFFICGFIHSAVLVLLGWSRSLGVFLHIPFILHFMNIGTGGEYGFYHYFCHKLSTGQLANTKRWYLLKYNIYMQEQDRKITQNHQ